MTDETTTEQLAEIEGQAEDTPATGYTPPEGWRVLAVGERLQAGDMWVWPTDDQLRQTVHVGAVVGANQRYIRPIEPQPSPQPQPAQVREGRWRTRGGEVKNIRPCEPLKGAYYVWPWTDGFMTFQDNGRHQGSQESAHDLVEYLGPIEPDKTQELPETGEESPDQLIGRISLLRRRVAQLEELVRSLRTINRGCENAVTEAGKENTALKNQLAAVKAELASVAADRQRLRVELDAAQQVPADSPELRQLRADLAEVAHDRDIYKHTHELLVQDIDAAHQRTKAETVERICEWIEPIRREDPHLRAVILFHLPKIMRSLAGLNSSEDVD